MIQNLNYKTDNNQNYENNLYICKKLVVFMNGTLLRTHSRMGCGFI